MDNDTTTATTMPTIKGVLSGLGFNWMGGKIYIPTHADESGFEEWKYGDPRLQAALDPEAETWHFHATDSEYFFCSCLVADDLRPPWTVCKVKLADLEIIQINPESLGEGPFLTPLHKQLLTNQDIWVGQISQNLFSHLGFLGNMHLAGLKEYGVFVLGKSESAALRILPKWVGLLGAAALQRGYNQNLARFVIGSGSTSILDKLKEEASQIKQEADDPESRLNEQLDQMFGAPRAFFKRIGQVVTK